MEWLGLSLPFLRQTTLRYCSMVKIDVLLDSHRRLVSLRCEGHAEFTDPEEGPDIVCAAVSALTGFLGITFAEVLGWPETVSAADGVFEFRMVREWDASSWSRVAVLWDGWRRSAMALEENYSGSVKLVESHQGSQEIA